MLCLGQVSVIIEHFLSHGVPPEDRKQRVIQFDRLYFTLGESCTGGSLSDLWDRFVDCCSPCQGAASKVMEGKILCVGLACIDIVQMCKQFPREDSDQRSVECRWSRGGNASNNCTVLSLLGNDCEFFGAVPNNLFWTFSKENFDSYGIDTSNCVIHDGSLEFPLSTVLVNNENGSRTIVHSNKNLPEITAQEFSRLDTSKYRWIHFEGRNPLVLREILQIAHAKAVASGFKISLELEKLRDGFLVLAQYADVVFISKDFALFHNWSDMKTAIEGMKEHVLPGATIVCAWGELGAAAYQENEGFVTSPAYPPRVVVDTLGAGDTFLAATIHCLSRHQPLQEAVDFGCRIAGAKVGARGYDVVKEAYATLNAQ